MNERCNRSNGESIVAASKNIRLCPSLKGFGLSDLLSEFNNIIEFALAWQHGSPGFPVAILDPVAVDEQVGEVVGGVDAEVPAGCNQREEECRDVSTGLGDAEKEVVVVYDPLADELLRPVVVAVGTVMIQEPGKFIVSVEEVADGHGCPAFNLSPRLLSLPDHFLKPRLHVFEERKQRGLSSFDEVFLAESSPAVLPFSLHMKDPCISLLHFDGDAFGPPLGGFYTFSSGMH